MPRLTLCCSVLHTVLHCVLQYVSFDSSSRAAQIDAKPWSILSPLNCAGLPQIALNSFKKALYSTERALCSIKRVLYAIKRDRYCMQRAIFVLRVVDPLTTQLCGAPPDSPILLQKSPVLYQNSPMFHQKSP